LDEILSKTLPKDVRLIYGISLIRGASEAVRYNKVRSPEDQNKG